jgi:nitrile hydratase subunit beta
LAGGSFQLSGPIGPGRPPTEPRSFEIGETVRVRNEYVPGHVRMPAYIRGKTGVVVAISPHYPFPDAAGHGMQAPMEPTYDVRFRSRDLWPDSCDDAFNHVGVFQSYLERVEA